MFLWLFFLLSLNRFSFVDELLHYFLCSVSVKHWFCANPFADTSPFTVASTQFPPEQHLTGQPSLKTQITWSVARPKVPPHLHRASAQWIMRELSNTSSAHVLCDCPLIFIIHCQPHMCLCVCRCMCTNVCNDESLTATKLGLRLSTILQTHMQVRTHMHTDYSRSLDKEVKGPLTWQGFVQIEENKPHRYADGDTSHFCQISVIM